MNNSIVLELCIESASSAVAAHRGGADRVELCSALSLGGVTPSAGLMHAVRAAFPRDLFVLIRPRAGDFTYTDAEFSVMRDDVLRARDLGANGVVFGLLRDDGSVDVDRTCELINLARPMQVTFHRAFDVTPNLTRAIDDVIACRADRILTSGGNASGTEGSSTIRCLVEQARGRIVILGAGGLRSSNVRAFIQATGVREVHTSLRLPAASLAYDSMLDSIFGAAYAAESRAVVTESAVREFRSVLQNL